jgi:mono/diheme cytochrome c family protein
MNRALHGLTLTASCLALSTTLFAGGWAVITLDTLPERIRAGEPITLGYTVRQHGARLLDGLNGAIEASAGSRRVMAAARWDGRPGHYVATLTMPEPGLWSLTIQSGFGGGQSTLSLLPLEVLEPAAHPAAEAASARGRQLFVAKGCATCHRIEGRASPAGAVHGPPLVPRKFQADYLARILQNPAVLPPAKFPFRMPNLGLDPPEIDALVAFINGAEHSSPGASRNRPSR